jgi:hypothetical protein
LIKLQLIDYISDRKMSKKQLGYELNKTLPIRNRQDKIFSYMLD